MIMTNDWTSGYMSEVGYTYGYYPEFNPLRWALQLLYDGYFPPSCETACELGFGQGLNVNIHAAASPVAWFGTDFNPAQAAFAQDLTRASGANSRIYDEAFAEFCSRSDLPDFDFIGFHGVWSWISDENRTVIVDFLKRKLKVGGVLYLSYYTHPGWAAMVPFRHLLTEHEKTMGVPGQGIVSRIDGALEFADRLLGTCQAYTRANPSVIERVSALKSQNRTYLAHEYFNRDWVPMHFADVARWLAPAKLDYVCSAQYMDHLDFLNLTVDQRQLLKGIASGVFRETIRDIMVNQHFRRDYWIKGARTLSRLAWEESIAKQQVILLTERKEVSLKAKGVLGEADMNEFVYLPILDVLADHKAKSIGEIVDKVKAGGLDLPKVAQAVMVLADMHLAPVQNDAAVIAVKPRVEALNAHLMNLARGSNDMAYLASPMTGGGVQMTRFQQLFLLAMKQGDETPEAWARFAWQILSRQSEFVLKDGRPLVSGEENVAELLVQAKEFARRLPIFSALKIV